MAFLDELGAKAQAHLDSLGLTGEQQMELREGLPDRAPKPHLEHMIAADDPDLRIAAGIFLSEVEVIRRDLNTLKLRPDLKVLDMDAIGKLVIRGYKLHGAEVAFQKELVSGAYRSMNSSQAGQKRAGAKTSFARQVIRQLLEENPHITAGQIQDRLEATDRLGHFEICAQREDGKITAFDFYDERNPTATDLGCADLDNIKAQGGQRIKVTSLASTLSDIKAQVKKNK
jgi:hypothetical protein